jgi:hypothetical protein
MVIAGDEFFDRVFLYTDEGECLRRGRATSSPAQFGQVCFIFAVQSGQKVHSYEQMYAPASSRSARSHFSQPIFISNATGNALLALAVVGKLLCFDCSQILALMDGR